jgi:uncharacterized protein (DUF488 family)
MLFTIGHSTRTAEEFWELLEAHGVKLLVDVRQFPGSRRYPHFGAESLAEFLKPHGIAYLHERELGGRRKPLADSPNAYWKSEGFRAYADYMRTEAFQQALERLMQCGNERPTAIMCAEAVPWRCHRQLIADALAARGIGVRHILSPTRADPHVLNPHARVEPDGSLVYPAPPAAQRELFSQPE